MNSIDVIDKLTRDIWNKINLSNIYQSIYGEETITDTTLLELLCLNSTSIRIIPTPKLDEAQRGSDWEWYIGSEKFGWIRYAIQAKKANPKTIKGNYNKINYYVNGNRQIDILRAYSNVNNCIPLYCFYNYQPSSTIKHWQCLKKFDQELLGWTVSSLENVEFGLNTRGGKNFNFLHSLENTLPTKCLFQCPKILEAYENNDMKILKNKFKSKVKIIKELPFSQLENYKINSYENLPDKYYDKKLGLYPSKIAIITLNNNDENKF